MKTMSLIAMLVLGTGICSMAQYSLSTNETDEFTGDVKKFTKAVSLGKTSSNTKVTTEVLRVNDTKYLRFNLRTDLGCVSKYSSTAHIKFVDGTILILFNVGDTECGDTPYFLFMPVEGDITSNELKYMTNDELAVESARIEKIFSTKKLEKIKFSGSEFYTVLTVDEDKQNTFSHLFNLVK